VPKDMNYYSQVDHRSNTLFNLMYNYNSGGYSLFYINSVPTYIITFVCSKHEIVVFCLWR